MKRLILGTAMALGLAQGAWAADWVKTYDALLQKYVSGDGVRYKTWHENASDLTALEGVTEMIGKEGLSGKSKEERLAFYLNAYNAWILQLILEDYPTDGPGGGGFFGRNRFFKSDSITVAGKVTSFSDLENEVIRAEFKEPRIHFALNCASASCPPLHGRAFRAGTLDATLTALAKGFLDGDPDGVKVEGGTAYVSKIFDWFAEDFGGAGKVKAYIDRYRKTPLPADVEFQDYSWELNEAERSGPSGKGLPR